MWPEHSKFQARAHRLTFLAVEKESASLSFGGTGDNDFDDVTKKVDGTVVMGRGRILVGFGTSVEEELSSGGGTGLGFVEMGGITENVKDHVAGLALDLGIQMC